MGRGQEQKQILEIHNHTIKFSGQGILVIPLRHVLELMKGELKPVKKRRYYLFILLVAAGVSCGIGLALQHAQNVQQDRQLGGAFLVAALVLAGAFLAAGALSLFVRIVAWAFRRREYGLIIRTVLDDWYTISSYSDELITDILETILLRMESNKPMQSVTFNVGNLDMSDRSTSNVNKTFVTAGRDARVGATRVGNVAHGSR